MTLKTKLYRHFDAEGRLLYVGISANAIKRLVQHRRSAWIEEIARIEIQYFDSRDDALKAEKEAIKTELPLFNKAHKTKARSETEEIFELIFNATKPELLKQVVMFSDKETYFSFLGAYQKYSHRKERRLART